MRAMANQKDFSPAEWTLLRLAPSFVSVGVSASDRSGLFASIREALAGAREVIEAVNKNIVLELFSALAADRTLPDIPDIDTLLGRGSKEKQMENFKRVALAQVVAAVDVLAKKASPTESDAYRKLLVGVAERAANASKEGSFLGFGGVRVSQKERDFIDAVKRAAGVE
jgi:hypothetical protein